MPKTRPKAEPTDAEIRTRVSRAIRAAEKAEPADDALFLRTLRAGFFGVAGAGAERTRRSLPQAVPRSSVTGDPSAHLARDPRYLRNARELTRLHGSGKRVVGGSDVKPKHYLDCVAVGNDSQWGCTGTLLHPRVVVTAGHCADFATRIFIGRDVSEAGRVVAVTKRVRHPKYHKGGKHNDLMLLLLGEDVAGVEPRTIAPGALIDAAGDARVVGFGNVDLAGSFGYGRKRFTDVPIASPSCAGSIAGEDDALAYGCDSDLELVAGKPLLGRDTCTGDSGGPLYIEDAAGRWLVAGATSRATDSANVNCGDGGVYVRLDRYRSWIESAAGVTLS